MGSGGPDSTSSANATDATDVLAAAPNRPSLPVKVAGFVILLIALWYAGRVLLLAFAGVLFGVLLNAVGGKISQWTGWNYRVCVVLVMLALLGLLAAVVWLFQATVLAQFEQLVNTIPDMIQRVKSWLQKYGWGRYLLHKMDGDPMISPQDVVSRAYGAASVWLTIMLDALVIFFVGFFGALEPHLYRRGLLHLVPPRRRRRFADVLDECMAALRLWIAGKLVSMAIVGVVTGVGLALIGIEAWLLLAIMAALLEFVPNFGPILAAAPALLLAISQGGSTVLWVALLYLAIQTIESNLILPLIQQQVVRLPPALSILAIILMGVWVGAIGVLVATPLLAVLIVCAKRFYVEDTLHESLDGEPV